MLALSISVYFVNQSLNKAAISYGWAEHSYELLYLAEKLNNSYDELNSALHTYFHDNDKKALSAFETHKKLIFDQLANLKTLTKDNTLQQERLALLSPIIRKQIKIMDRAAHQVLRDSELAGPEFIANNAKIKNSLTNFEHVESALLKSRSLNSAASLEKTKTKLFVAFFIALLILFFANLAIFYLLEKQRKIFNEKEKLYALHNAIINKANEAIITTDPSGHILSFNPAAQTIFGYTEEEILGKPFTLFLNEELREKCKESGFDKFLADQIELNGIKKDGTQVPLLASFVKIVLNEAPSIYSIILHDLSKYKIQENKILKLSNRLSLATDLAGLSVWDWDLQTNTFYFEKFLFDDLPLKRKNKDLFHLLSERFFSNEIFELKKQALRKFARGEKYIEAELHFIKDAKNIRYLKSKAYIQYDKNNNPIMLNGVTWDITDLKNAAESQKQAKEAAEEASKAKSQFLANMSHEIRTPLNAIIGLNLLLRHTRLDEKQKDYVSKIHLSATSLLSIINDLLNFSKIEAGKLQIEKTKFNIDLVLNRLSKDIYLNIRDKELELIFNQAPHIPPTLYGDPLRISQILNNLISNAIKFTEKGQIIVSVEPIKKDEQQITLRFSVKDTGIGIAEDQLPNLFKSFTQADVSISRKYGGTGLGLSICKQLVEMMNGKIWAQSKKGEGSVFHFELTFPYDKTKDKTFYQPPIELRNLRILIVDDIAEIRATIQEQMTIFTQDTTAVATGEEAINELRNALVSGNKYYDLVILDWKLANEDGLEIAKLIHNDQQIPLKPKIIMISAYVDGEYLLQDKTYFNAFLTKPFTLSVLFNSVLEVFGKEVRQEFDTYSMTNVYPKGFDQIRGANILVAEDNELNQQVIKELLENEGFYVTIANDGKQAVEQLLGRSSAFDLVLMDLHMPEMNGFEATRIIRRNKALKAIPVIALTADLAGNVQRKIKEVGMVDFISKPINPDDLFAVITRWIKPSNRVVFHRNMTTNKTEGELRAVLSSIPELDYLDGLRRLNFNYQLYAELLIKFRHNNLHLAQQLNTLLQNGNMQEFHRLVHTLKSTAGNMGFKNLQKWAARLEAASSTLDIEKIQELSEKVENKIQETIDLLKPFEAKLKDYLSVEEVIAFSKEELIKELRFVLQLLKEADARAKERVNRLIPALTQAGFSKQAPVLWQLIENYRFDDAAQIIEELIALSTEK